jgi:Ni,Fe-hydrogenase III large subunit/Ni,Fe-hydrogenase III component G
MDHPEIVSHIRDKFPGDRVSLDPHAYPDELRMHASPESFKGVCLELHKILSSPVMMLFALDERAKLNKFVINCVFADMKKSRWIIVSMDTPPDKACFDSLSKDIYSASLFEREIKEMFGIEPTGNPDPRRLNLHDEVWPQGNYPLRKDFVKMQDGPRGDYRFNRVEGSGVFEVPVGPVHAGIIGPGHFRFSVAGEPIINLETRFGFTHRGAEKLFEGRPYPEAVRISECISGDSAFAHSLAFINAAEKIVGVSVPAKAAYTRGILLELERMYNHVNDIGGIAIDVGFSFPAAYASIIKEAILQLNEKLTGSRYLKNVNLVGGVSIDIDETGKRALLESLGKIKRDIEELARMLEASVSFMDRVDTTGALRRKTAEDIGVVGLAARASGIPMDLRKYFPGIYKDAKFNMITQASGDVLARLRVRISESGESCRLIEEFARDLKEGEEINVVPELREGCAIGYTEGWRGPVLYWLKTDAGGSIERCKIVDPSFHNWQGLSYAVLGNIIPDFPVCNKSFDLSYSGNDL